MIISIYEKEILSDNRDYLSHLAHTSLEIQFKNYLNDFEDIFFNLFIVEGGAPWNHSQRFWGISIMGNGTLTISDSILAQVSVGLILQS